MYVQILYIWCAMSGLFILCFPPLICTEIVVAVLLPFFSSSPSCYLLNANSSGGVALVVSLRILPLIWCAFVSGLHCIHTDASRSPFGCTESYFDCEKCVLCRDETCSPENSRDNNSQRRGRPRWARPALRSRKSSRKFPQPPPLCPPSLLLSWTLGFC